MTPFRRFTNVGVGIKIRRFNSDSAYMNPWLNSSRVCLRSLGFAPEWWLTRAPSTKNMKYGTCGSKRGRREGKEGRVNATHTSRHTHDVT